MESTTKTNQATRILRLLKANEYVTNVDLNKISFRYTARIHELKADGYLIEWRTTKRKGVNEYWLVREQEYGDAS